MKMNYVFKYELAGIFVSRIKDMGFYDSLYYGNNFYFENDVFILRSSCDENEANFVYKPKNFWIKWDEDLGLQNAFMSHDLMAEQLHLIMVDCLFSLGKYEIVPSHYKLAIELINRAIETLN
ncbi:MAG: hypothetical protein N2043_01435 [Ignavibacterium sp.]|nr:hypothetical protein [Ignavibacterium sp.]